MNAVALVTGGSRGIGRGIAIELAKEGLDLVLNFASDSKAATESALACSAAAAEAKKTVRIETCQADIASASARESLVQFVERTFGRLDVLINNAGVAPKQRVDLLESSEDSFDRLIGINVKGPFFLTQRVARWMIDQRKRQVGQDRDRYQPKIITISSLSAYTASVMRGEYCISKAALSMLTPLFAARLAEFGINVYEIRPGLIATDMTAPVKEKYDALIEQGLTPISRWGVPADVGRAVAGIVQGWLPFSTGEVLNVDGGFHLRRL